MKTDKQKVIDLLTELGIGFTVDSQEYNLLPPNNIYIGTDDSGAEGYSSFCNIFEFDEDDKFKILGIWE